MGRFGSGLDDTAYGRNHYAIWDFNTTYAAAKNVDVYFKVNNITNKMYYIYPSNNYPFAGRSFQIGAKVSF